MRLRRIRGGEIGSRLTTASDASACAPPGGTAARSDHRAPREHVHALQGEYGSVAGVAAVFVFRVLHAKSGGEAAGNCADLYVGVARLRRFQ